LSNSASCNSASCKRPARGGSRPSGFCGCTSRVRTVWAAGKAKEREQSGVLNKAYPCLRLNWSSCGEVGMNFATPPLRFIRRLCFPIGQTTLAPQSLARYQTFFTLVKPSSPLSNLLHPCQTFFTLVKPSSPLRVTVWCVCVVCVYQPFLAPPLRFIKPLKPLSLPTTYRE
jgi:hypothetical protein